MQTPYAQIMPKIRIISDPAVLTSSREESLIHWDFPEDEEPCGEITCINSMDWNAQNPDEIREWRDDYYTAIRL